MHLRGLDVVNFSQNDGLLDLEVAADQICVLLGFISLKLFAQPRDLSFQGGDLGVRLATCSAPVINRTELLFPLGIRGFQVKSDHFAHEVDGVLLRLEGLEHRLQVPRQNGDPGARLHQLGVVPLQTAEVLVVRELEGALEDLLVPAEGGEAVVAVVLLLHQVQQQVQLQLGRLVEVFQVFARLQQWEHLGFHIHVYVELIVHLNS